MASSTSRPATRRGEAHASPSPSPGRGSAPVSLGGIVLVGGRSSRMGTSKALLDWHGRTAVEHAVSVVRESVEGGPVCVVRTPGQEIPALDAIVVEDLVAYGGPLAALHAGLAILDGKADVVFACGVDTPLLVPAFARVVLASLRDGDDAVMPVIGGRAQPLLAAYRVAIAPAVDALLVSGALGLRNIPSSLSVRQLTEDELLADAELRVVDPELRSARNANTPYEWEVLRGGGM